MRKDCKKVSELRNIKCAVTDIKFHLNVENTATCSLLSKINKIFKIFKLYRHIHNQQQLIVTVKLIEGSTK